MLIKDAINFITQSNPFRDKISAAGINLDSCRRLDVRLVGDNINNVFYYDFIFDFGNAGPSKNDVIARVRINDDGSFRIVDFS